MQDPDEEIQDYAHVKELEATQQDEVEEEDRLSTLPDKILFEILTLLPVKEIFGTSTLSRHWRNLDIPADIPLLIFSHRSTTAQDSAHVQEFFDSIEVSLHGRCFGIAGFCIDFPFRSRFQEDVVSLILQAVTCKVKNLNLILTNEDPTRALHNDIIGRRFHFFLLPAFLYENPLLEMLSFSMCSFDDLQEIKWGFLKELKIGSTSLRSGNTSVIKKIVLGCPVLEVLELNNCWGFKYLNFDDHAKLKKLVVNQIWFKYEEAGHGHLFISAPSVRSLELLGDFCLRIVKLRRMNNCVEAKLDYRTYIDEYFCSINALLRNLNSLRHVQTLTCGTWMIEVISWNGTKGFPLELAECKYLTLHSPLQCQYQLGILRLLESTPNTEELVIHAARSTPMILVSFGRGDISLGVKHVTTKHSKRWGFRFKTLQITNFGGRHFANEISFLNFILVNARQMEYMVID